VKNRGKLDGKLSCPILRHKPRICLERLKKTVKTVHQNSRDTGRESICGSLEYGERSVKLSDTVVLKQRCS
jgi:hypothetical protein